jgi:hypothetical protein
MINFDLYDNTKELVAREFFENGEKNLSGTCVSVGWSTAYIEAKGGIDMDLLHRLCEGKYDVTRTTREIPVFVDNNFDNTEFSEVLYMSRKVKKNDKF